MIAQSNILRNHIERLGAALSYVTKNDEKKNPGTNGLDKDSFEIFETLL